MNTRYSFGGDEHVFVEVDEEMSLEAFFKSLSITNAVRDARIKGVTEICPANASYQVKFDPDVIKPDDMLAELKQLEVGGREVRAGHRDADHRDPGALQRSVDARDADALPRAPSGPESHRHRIRRAHQQSTTAVDDFIEAHSGSPWFVSMVGFVAGLPFLYQMVERKRQIEVPKYLRPRTDTPKLTVGHGGCFGCIYSVRGAGGYQMFGITPMPIYDPNQQISYLRDFMVLLPARRHREVEADRPRTPTTTAVADVEAGRFAPRHPRCHILADEFNADIDGYNRKLEGVLHGH